MMGFAGERILRHCGQICRNEAVKARWKSFTVGAPVPFNRERRDGNPPDREIVGGRQQGKPYEYRPSARHGPGKKPDVTLRGLHVGNDSALEVGRPIESL
jgi:hypothetical protein